MNTVFFWRLRDPYAFLSNWYPATFVDKKGIQYKNSEQYFMYQKAKLFGDDELAEKILQTASPQKAKELGRKVNIKRKKWDENKIQTMYDANWYKFSQNPDLKRKLLNTNNSYLVEASPYDNVWGIGISKEDARSISPEKWKGENYLGRILMLVRQNL